MTFKFEAGPLDGLDVRGSCNPTEMAQFRGPDGSAVARQNWFDWFDTREHMDGIVLDLIATGIDHWYVMAPDCYTRYVWLPYYAARCRLSA